MALTINKAAAKPKLKPAQAPKVEIDPSDMTLEELADEYGNLNDEVEAIMMDPRIHRLKEVQKALLKGLDSYEPQDSLTIKGSKWRVEAGPCSKSPRKIVDMEKSMKFLGKETFMKLASIGVGDAEKYMTPEQVEQVASEVAYTKNRKLVAHHLG